MSVFGLFKKAPKLAMTFTPTQAVARELAREVEVAGELVVRNLGKDVDLAQLEVLLVAGGTRRIDLELPAAWRGSQRRGRCTRAESRASARRPAGRGGSPA